LPADFETPFECLRKDFPKTFHFAYDNYEELVSPSLDCSQISQTEEQQYSSDDEQIVLSLGSGDDENDFSESGALSRKFPTDDQRHQKRLRYSVNFIT
jgi:hypothetical protein